MIVNHALLPALQSEWEGVVRARDRVRNLVVSTFVLDTNQSSILGDILYNLPMLLAFDVLTKVLLFARAEGQFISSRHHLGDLMDGSRTTLSWLDWDRLRKGVMCHTQIAHGGKLLEDVHCLQYIAAIEAQLVDWGIIGSSSARLHA